LQVYSSRQELNRSMYICDAPGNQKNIAGNQQRKEGKERKETKQETQERQHALVWNVV